MTRATPPVTPEATEQIQTGGVNRRQSHLEKTYGQFHDKTIDAANKSRPGSGGLMRDFNRMFAICTGLATVMRIASGNDVMEDFHDPDDSDSEPPLSRGAINTLTTMAAAVCDVLADEISRSADHFNGSGEQA